MPNIYVASSSTKTTLLQLDVTIPMSDNTFYASLGINVQDKIVNMCCFRVKMMLHDWLFFNSFKWPIFFHWPIFGRLVGELAHLKNVLETSQPLHGSVHACLMFTFSEHAASC